MPPESTAELTHQKSCCLRNSQEVNTRRLPLELLTSEAPVSCSTGMRAWFLPSCCHCLSHPWGWGQARTPVQKNMFPYPCGPTAAAEMGGKRWPCLTVTCTTSHKHFEQVESNSQPEPELQESLGIPFSQVFCRAANHRRPQWRQRANSLHHTVFSWVTMHHPFWYKLGGI